MKPKTIAIIELSLLALFIALFLWWTYPEPGLEPLVTTATSTRALPFFEAPAIEAQSAFVYDARNHKTLFEKDPDTIRPLASLSKLMSALVASNTVPNYLLVHISPDDVREEGDTGLWVDEAWNVDKLIDFSLITSSNDGIHAIAAAAGAQISSTSTAPIDLFVDKMNSFAKSIDLADMHFNNQSGLDISKTTSGAYGSARDVALLVGYLLKNAPHLAEATILPSTHISSEQRDHIAVNTDLAIPNIPNLILSKTGYTDLSGGNVVVAFNAGLDHPIIVSVLGSSYDGRFADLEALVRSTLQYLSKAAQ